MKPFWLVQEVCGARRLLRSSRKTSLVSDETIFQFARGVNIFQFKSCRCCGSRFARLAVEIAAVVRGQNRFGELGS